MTQQMIRRHRKELLLLLGRCAPLFLQASHHVNDQRWQANVYQLREDVLSTLTNMGNEIGVDVEDAILNSNEESNDDEPCDCCSID